MANIFFMKEVRCASTLFHQVISNIFIASLQQVEVSEGKDSIKKYADKDTDSGAPLTRSFCTNCGASLFIKSGVPEHANIVIVPTGLIEDTFEWGKLAMKQRGELYSDHVITVPTFENHAAERRQWVKELEVITG